MPPDDEAWLCPGCMDSDLYILEAILDKKVMAQRLANGKCGNRIVHFKCRWMGYDSAGDTWEPLCNIPLKGRGLVNDYNKGLRKTEGGSSRATPVAEGSAVRPTKKAKAT